MKIIKLTFWLNPTTLTSVGGPRWDAEIVFEDKTHKRVVNIDKKEAQGLIGEALNPKDE